MALSLFYGAQTRFNWYERNPDLFQYPSFNLVMPYDSAAVDRATDSVTSQAASLVLPYQHGQPSVRRSIWISGLPDIPARRRPIFGLCGISFAICKRCEVKLVKRERAQRSP